MTESAKTYRMFIDGRWVDLDATLPVPYHAGHVLVSTAAMADGSGSRDLAGLMVMVGNVDVDVIELDHAAYPRRGRPVRRPPPPR